MQPTGGFRRPVGSLRRSGASHVSPASAPPFARIRHRTRPARSKRGLYPDRQEDTLARTALTLSTRQISVFYDSSLQANDLGHHSVLETSSGEASEVRLGRLEGHRALRLGPLGPESGDDPPPSGPNHELRLVRNGSTWALDARPPANEDEEQDAGAPFRFRFNTLYDRTSHHPRRSSPFVLQGMTTASCRCCGADTTGMPSSNSLS